jgi:transcriptional regulator with XRE-family HTH domain
MSSEEEKGERKRLPKPFQDGDEQLGNIIRDIRKKRRWGRDLIVKKLKELNMGISRNTIGDFEEGKKLPSLGQLKAILEKALKVTPAEAEEAFNSFPSQSAATLINQVLGTSLSLAGKTETPGQDFAEAHQDKQNFVNRPRKKF